MSYKTILVHLSDKRRTEAVLAQAIALASRFGSHLIGVHAYAAMPAPPIPVPFAAQVLGGIAASAQENADAIAATFARMTARGTFVSEWQVLKVPHVDLASVVMERGRASDLIVAGQADPDWELAPLLDFPERLALEGGRPVLVVPYASEGRSVGRTVAVAWKPTRESARAVFDALPLLKAAESVHIIEIREGSDKAPALTPDTSIAAALGRHGIKPTIHSSLAPDSSVGEEILSRVADLGADLLVMGAYGHSRMRQLVFGGATRSIARHMTVPTLFSH